MKTIHLAGCRPLLLLILIIAFLFACKKDNLAPATETIVHSQNPSHFSISIEEALVYYSGASAVNANSAGNFGVRPFVELEPVWGQAYSSLTQSGIEVIVVPLADSTIRVNNQGRADAKLLFKKISQDSIVAQIMLFVADSSYFVSQGNTLNFSNFTGVFVLFDLAFHFQDGVVVQSGTPINSVDSASVVHRTEVFDREEIECDQVVDVFVYTTCYEQVFTNNYCLEEADTYIWWDCHPSGGGGTGGGTGGGGTGGGGTGGGTANPPTYWEVFSGQIPVGAFTGALPPGFDLQLFQQLVDIIKANSFSVEQVKWLMNHTVFISIIWNISGPNQAGEEAALIAPVLNFTMQHNLNAEQYQYLIYHPNEFAALKTFLLQHPNDSKANQLVQGLLVFTQTLTGLTLAELNFLYENIDGIEVAADEPMNPPITSTQLICAEILDFATLTDAQNNFQYSGMHLTDGYYGFDIPGFGTQIQFHIRDMHMIVNANSTNTNCLPSTASMAADAINLSVSQTQQLFNNLPPVQPTSATLNSLRSTLLINMDRNFRSIAKSCNSVYTSSVYVYAPGLSNPGDGLPINNIDVKSPVCH